MLGVCRRRLWCCEAWPRAGLRLRRNIWGNHNQIEGSLGDLLREAPTLTFNELTLSRTTPEQPVVQAKLLIVVYLAEYADPSNAGVNGERQ